MARIYSALFSGVAVTAQQDLFELNCPADAVLVLHAIHLSQSTEVGDAQEEGLSILLKSGQTTSGSGGTAPTAVPLSFGDPAFGGTVEVNNTTKASVGTIVTHYAWNWNVRMPFDVIWTPETRPMFSPSRRGTLELGTTPADSITMSGWILFEEVGG
jgi:hypothetical protein